MPPSFPPRRSSELRREARRRLGHQGIAQGQQRYVLEDGGVVAGVEGVAVVHGGGIGNSGLGIREGYGLPPGSSSPATGADALRFAESPIPNSQSRPGPCPPSSSSKTKPPSPTPCSTRCARRGSRRATA